MKHNLICLATQILLISGIYVIPVNAQDSVILNPNILQAIQKNVDFLEEQITNFLSHEETTIEEFDNKGRIKKTTKIISEYRAVLETAKPKQFYSVQSNLLNEERNVLSAKENGKDKKIKNYPEPFPLKTGDGYTDLFVVFSKENEKYFDYKVKGIEKNKERNAFIIEIQQKENDIGKIENWSWNVRYEGYVWVDIDTLEVIQLKRNMIAVEYKIIPEYIVVKREYFSTRYEYDKVWIKSQFLMLPVIKTIELFQENGQLSAVYKYNYSDFKSFDSSINIFYGDELHE